MTHSLSLVPGNNETLRNKNVSIETWTPELDSLVSNMFQFAIECSGIGLAAPQVGINIKLAVIDITMGANLQNQLVLINPTIIKTFGSNVYEEGCLSLPKITRELKRPKKIVYKNMTSDGKYYTAIADGLLARAILHEVDHLNGILFTDYK